MVRRGQRLLEGVNIEILQIEKMNPVSPFSRVGTIRFYDPRASANVYALTCYRNCLYAGLYFAEPLVIKKVDLSTFAESDSLRLVESDEKQTVDFAVDTENDMLYAGHYYPNGGKVSKIDLRTFSWEDSLSLGEGYYHLDCLGIIPDEYLYAGLNQAASPAKIVRINLFTFTKANTLTLASGYEGINDIYVDEANSLVYATLGTGQLIKVQADLSSYDSLDLGEGALLSIARSGNYLYVGGANKIVKVNMSSFTKEAVLEGIPGSVYDLVVVGNYLYGCLHTSPGKVIKVSLDEFALESTLTLESDEGKCVHIASDGKNLYVSLFEIPGGVCKIDLVGKNVSQERVGEIGFIEKLGRIEAPVKTISRKRFQKQTKTISPSSTGSFVFSVPEGATGCLLQICGGFLGGVSTSSVIIKVYQSADGIGFDTEPFDQETIAYSSESTKVQSFIFPTPGEAVKFEVQNQDSSLELEATLEAVFF